MLTSASCILCHRRFVSIQDQVRAFFPEGAEDGVDACVVVLEHAVHDGEPLGREVERVRAAVGVAAQEAAALEPVQCMPWPNKDNPAPQVRAERRWLCQLHAAVKRCSA